MLESQTTLVMSETMSKENGTNPQWFQDTMSSLTALDTINWWPSGRAGGNELSCRQHRQQSRRSGSTTISWRCMHLLFKSELSQKEEGRLSATNQYLDGCIVPLHEDTVTMWSQCDGMVTVKWQDLQFLASHIHCKLLWESRTTNCKRRDKLASHLELRNIYREKKLRRLEKAPSSPPPSWWFNL